MKNVLFIVYYFPPMGGSGVQRPLKFVKYLREFGWNPIVLCPEPGAYHTFDDSLDRELKSLEIEIHRVKGNTIFHSFGGKKKRVQFPSTIENLLRKVSTFFWMPDNKKGWIEPALNKASEIISNQSIDAVFSTANPYSNLILAKKIKERFQIPLIMDLRDEWLESHLIDYPTSWHYKKMKRIENETLSSADIITVINDAYKESFGNRFPQKEIRVLSNGYDPEDFSRVFKPNRNKEITILYSGLFYGDRKPDNFLKAVKNVISERPDLKKFLKLQFQGGLDSASKQIIMDLSLSEITEDLGYIPHKKAVQNLLKADILLLMMGHLSKANLVTVGKLFEYFATNKPIFALIPEGETMNLLNKYRSYYIADPNSVEAIKYSLLNIIEDYQNDTIPEANADFAKKFDRQILTGNLGILLDKIVTDKKT